LTLAPADAVSQSQTSAVVPGGPITVLVADADRASRRLAAAALRHGGYLVEVARTSKEAVSVLRRHRLGAVVVDPDDLEAVGVLEDLRLRTEVPIIVVSTLDGEQHKVAALDAGADDYLSKPFGVNELLARMRAALRRTSTPDTDPIVVTPHFTVDLGGRRVKLGDGSEVHLTPTEWKIIDVLVRRPGAVVPHADLLEEVWGVTARDKTQYLRVYMAGIRRKIEPAPSNPRYVLTYAGLGHSFQPEGRTADPTPPISDRKSLRTAGRR
jgi:two-component system, OmpR family, KDP operon response regulator KdpE